MKMDTSYSALSSFIPALHQQGPKTVLHVGCGNSPAFRMPHCFQGKEWEEIRLDIDPLVKPDIVADLIDMSAINDESVDAVWSSHNLEHLDDFNVPLALAEIHRVLKPNGFALITLPDMEHIARLIVNGKIDEILYVSPAGPITPLDMLFGHQASQRRGNRHMAHRTGFTAERLGNLLIRAGFTEVRVCPGKNYDLWAVAVKA